MYESTSVEAVRESATLAISPSVMRGLWITASCTSLFGSRSSSVRTSLLPRLFAHSIFFAIESRMTCWVMLSFFWAISCSSAASSSGTPGTAPS